MAAEDLDKHVSSEALISAQKCFQKQLIMVARRLFTKTFSYCLCNMRLFHSSGNVTINPNPFPQGF
jgi:hypothetical protein